MLLSGRGAKLVPKHLPNVLHIRLVASLERRIQHTQEIRNVDKKTALDLIQREDQGRERYLKKYFNQDVDDPLLYDLVLNTDLVSYQDSARLIGDAALLRLEHNLRSVSTRQIAREARAIPLAHAH